MRIHYHVFEPSIDDGPREDRCGVCGNGERRATGTGHVETQGEANRLNAVSWVRHCSEIEDLEAVDDHELSLAFDWSRRNDEKLFDVVRDEIQARVDRALAHREAQWG